MVNATLFALELWMHLGVCLALKKLESSLANSYASFVRSNLPRASITQ